MSDSKTNSTRNGALPDFNAPAFDWDYIGPAALRVLTLLDPHLTVEQVGILLDEAKRLARIYTRLDQRTIQYELDGVEREEARKRRGHQ